MKQILEKQPSPWQGVIQITLTKPEISIPPHFESDSDKSLAGRACTYINLEVQLLMTVICCQAGVLMYGLSP